MRHHEAPLQPKRSTSLVEDEEADIMQKIMEESLKDAYPAPLGPLPPVVIKEPEPGKFQLLPKVQGKGKDKVSEEQAGQVLLNLQTQKKKNLAKQFIFQRGTPATAEPSGLVESSSLYAELFYLTMRWIMGRKCSELKPNVHHMDLGIAEAPSQPNTEKMDEELTVTTYLKVQENLKLTTDRISTSDIKGFASSMLEEHYDKGHKDHQMTIKQYQILSSDETQDMVSDDEDIGSRHIPRVNLNQDWFKPLSKDERLLTLTALSIPYESTCPIHTGICLSSSYLLYSRIFLSQTRTTPVGGPQSPVTIQTEFFFNKDLDYLRFGSKGDKLALSITKMKALYYPNVRLEQMVPVQI
ncbi:hypothetical protein Tco_1385373 [Tanacetum coccineum]